MVFAAKLCSSSLLYQMCMLEGTLCVSSPRHWSSGLIELNDRVVIGCKMLVMQCTVMLHFLGLTSIQCGHNYGLLGNYGQRCPSHILTLTLNISSRYLSPTISYINNSITVFSSCGDRRYFCLLPCWDLVNTPSLIFLHATRPWALSLGIPFQLGTAMY